MGKRLFRVSYLYDSVDIFACSPEECSFENALWDFRLARLRLDVQKGEVDITLKVWAKPWL